MHIWEEMQAGGFEQLLFGHDEQSGLQAVVAVHNTKLGPALGGCRLWTYASEEEAVRDALRLSRAMTYKCAISGLPYGGGKAVIMNRPGVGKNEALFRSLGRFIDSMNGRYITGIDLGTTVEHMDWVSKETRHVTDTPGSLGAAGAFTAEMTAYGVFLGIQASLAYATGSGELANKTVAVQGLGKVGQTLCRLLHQAGSKLVVADIDERRAQEAGRLLGANAVCADAIAAEPCDVFAPCALGGVLNETSIAKLRCSVVAGAANNQLAEERHGAELQRRGIVYAPDYVINAGGIIVTGAELAGSGADAAKHQVETIPSTLVRVFKQAEQRRVSTSEAAELLALQALGDGKSKP